MDKTKMKRTAKVVATGIIIAELAILDYVAVQMTKGIEVSYDLSELPAAEQAALSDMEEGE